MVPVVAPGQARMRGTNVRRCLSAADIAGAPSTRSPEVLLTNPAVCLLEIACGSPQQRLGSECLQQHGAQVAQDEIHDFGGHLVAGTHEGVVRMVSAAAAHRLFEQLMKILTPLCEQCSERRDERTNRLGTTDSVECRIHGIDCQLMHDYFLERDVNGLSLIARLV